MTSDATDEEAPDEKDSSSGRPSTRLLAMVALLTAILVATATFGLTQRTRANDAEQRLDARTDIALAASRFGEAYLSFSADDVDGTSSRILDLATDTFAADFSDTRAPSLEQLFSELGTSTRARATDVFVGDATDRSARALVVVEVDAITEATGSQTIENLSFLVDFVLEGDRWLVDRVEPTPQPNLRGEDSAAEPSAGDPTAPATSAPDSPVPEDTEPAEPNG